MIRFVTIFSMLMFSLSVQAGAEQTTGRSWQEAVTGMEFVRVPKGCFQIGGAGLLSGVEDSKAQSANRVWHDGPGTEFVHENTDLDEKQTLQLVAIANAATPLSSGKRICFARDFWMAKYEVTQAQYEKVMGANPASFKKGSDYPVERVRWFDARSYIRKLNASSAKKFRLPSEAEWEYAARSGGQNQLYGANSSLKKAAWYMLNSSISTHPVGKKEPNALGLYDMSGNVWEWTADCWNETLEAVPADGSASETGDCTTRVLRGGSWYDAEELVRTNSRLWNDADKRDNNSGFRIVFDGSGYDL